MDYGPILELQGHYAWAVQDCREEVDLRKPYKLEFPSYREL